MTKSNLGLSLASTYYKHFNNFKNNKMKKYFKFIPVALAAIALASCSTDEFETSSVKKQDVANKGDLRMSWDAFDNDVPTRTMRDNNFGTLTFEEGDQVNVYDEGLYSVDWYTFKEDAFYYESEGEKMVETPKYGVMPGKNVKKAYTDRATRTTRVDMEIPQIITYEEGDGLYACNLPAFGYASLNAEEGYVEVSKLRYMTSILKIDLEKAVGNASWLRLINYGYDGILTQPYSAKDNADCIGSMAKPLSGTLTAELYSDESKRKDVKLAALDEDLPWAPYLYIDLRSVPSNTSVIYIPVVPGLDGDVDNIRLEYSANRTEEDPNQISCGEWETIPGMSFPGKEFKQHSRYTGSAAFSFEDMNPKLVSDILAQYQTTSSDIDIDITKMFTINVDEPTIDNVIYVPNFENDVDVNITLGDEFATWTKAGTKALRIEDADPENPFTGTITLNYGDVIKSQAAGDASVHVDLKAGRAIIAGEFDNTQKINPIAGNIQVGDGSTTTSGITWGSAGIGVDALSITIAENATMTAAVDLSATDNKTTFVKVDGELNGAITAGPLTESVIVDGTLTGDIVGSEATTEITLGEDGTMTGDITADAGITKDTECNITIDGALQGDITGALGGLWTNLDIDGTVDGAIDLKDAVKGAINITTDLEDVDGTVVTGDVKMKGDVTIALATEGEAIKGKLSMYGAAKTLKLVQGYVGEIEVDVNNAGSWEDKYINLTLNDENEGLVNFNKLTLAAENTIKYTPSIWNGEYATNSTWSNGVHEFTTVSYDGTDIATSALFTATQLAVADGQFNKKVQLLNDIDLKDKNTWKGFNMGGASLKCYELKVNAAKEVELSAKARTISNLNLTAASGLINTNTAATSIKDLTIATVKGTKAADASNIGALIGTNNKADATFENITVSGIDIKAASLKKLQNVGGLVGNNTVAVTLKDVTVGGAIDGYIALGGLVGATSAAVVADGCDASGIAFKQTFDSDYAMDLDYAKVGGFIGTVTSDAVITITDGTAPATINFDKTAKMYTSDTGTSTGKFYNFVKKQNFIGLSGTAGSGSFTQSIGYSTINDTKYCAEAAYANTEDTHDHAGPVTYTYLWIWSAKK